MATNTENYSLTKPDTTEYYDISVQNENMNKIDAQMKANADDQAAHKADTVAHMTQAQKDTLNSAVQSASLGGVAVPKTGQQLQIPMPTATQVGAARVSSITAATLPASGWIGSAAPYSQTISVSGVTATSANEILPGASITADELEALQAANIQDGGQASDSITLKAWGDKPTVDLPVRIIVRGDM